MDDDSDLRQGQLGSKCDAIQIYDATAIYLNVQNVLRLPLISVHFASRCDTTFAKSRTSGAEIRDGG